MPKTIKKSKEKYVPKIRQESFDGKVVTKACSKKYIGGLKLWQTGLMEDPNPGSKRGKGVQHLNSDYWIADMGEFIFKNLNMLKQSVTRQRKFTHNQQYIYFLNQSNVAFIHALKHGLKTKESEESWLYASWCAMAAAEIDNYKYAKYTDAERNEKRQLFYDNYNVGNTTEKKMPTWRKKHPLVFAETRIDLLPGVSLERVSLHNELCQVKYGPNANQWMRDGFPLSKRVDSLKRHIDESHQKLWHEDAIAHLIWNFMAIYHVLKVMPEKNDLLQYEGK